MLPRSLSTISYSEIPRFVMYSSISASYSLSSSKSLENKVYSTKASCAEVGKKPDKPYTGTFNVHVNTELHRKAAILSKQRNISMNQLVGEALARYVGA